MAGGGAVEEADRQLEDAREHLAAQPRDHAPPDVTHEVGLGEVAQAAQHEQRDHRQRHPHDGARIALGEGRVPEPLGERCETGLRGGVEDRPQQADRELQAVGPHIAQQAAVGLETAAAVERQQGAARGGQGGRRVQGLPAGSSLTVAMFTSANPSRPSTSMAVMTDW